MEHRARHISRTQFTWRERLGLCSAAVAVLVVQLDWLAVNLALPRIASYFSRPATDLHWIITGFMLAFGGVLPLTGRLIDAHGRRLVTIYGMATFLAGSAVCAAAPDVLWLIAGRVGQGVGGAFVVPGAVGMISAVLEGHQKDVGLGFILGAAGAGAAFGPFIGGLLAEFNWRYVFIVNIPLCLASMPIIYWCVTPSRDSRKAAGRAPLLHAVSVVLGFVGVTLALDRGSTWGWTSFPTLTSGGGGVLLLVAFALQEARGKRSLHDRALYRDRSIRMLTIIGTLAMATYVLLTTLSVLYLQEAQGLSSISAGCVFLALSVPDAVSSYAAGRVAGSGYTYAWLCGAMASATVGVLMVTWSETLGPYVLAFVLCGLGVGLAGGLTNVLTQQHVPPEQAGAAMSLTLAAKMLASATVISLAATGLESLNEGSGAAATNTSAVESVLRGSALLPACGFALLLFRAAKVARTRTQR
ncbi:MFS transporter [Streptomyces sp. NPDC048639]|uniref:MFS transporter n=1 Tax=Streptomyces sp. NPDC048639 TaxID=3365581 RepID=UPI003715B755